jgi:hypothetical protein
MPVKINGATSGSVTLAAPDTGSDVTLTLPAAAGTAATTAYADTAGGLQLITEQTFSAVSAVNVNNCFTSTYRNYRVLVEASLASGSNAWSLRLRSSGSDTATNYQNTGFETNLSVTGRIGSDGSVMKIGVVAANGGFSSIDLFAPNVAVSTKALVANGAYLAGSNLFDISLINLQTDATQFDGFSIFPPSSTITGTLRVYGYKNGA